MTKDYGYTPEYFRMLMRKKQKGDGMNDRAREMEERECEFGMPRKSPETLRLSVKNVVGHELCVSSRDGDKLYNILFDALNKDRHVEMSFKGVSTITACFLNPAIGTLYGKFSFDKIRASLKVKDISNDDKMLIKAVTDNAKEYFTNPEKMAQRPLERLAENESMA